MNQETVKSTYLEVINETITNLQKEFTDKGLPESAVESLDFLKNRWEARLTKTHEFTDDPLAKPSASAARSGKKAPKPKKPSKKAAAAAAKSSSSSSSTPAAPPPAMSLTNLTNPDSKPLPPVPRTPKVESVPDTSGPPPAKRPRIDAPPPRPYDDDGCIEDKGEDLDSSDDSDLPGDESEDEAENLVLAQHDKVKKGNKWKITLRDGIVAIRGREYLFNKATCELEF